MESTSEVYIRTSAEKSFKGYRDRERKRTATYSGILGNQSGDIDVPGREGFVYVRLNADPRNLIQVRNADSIQRVADLPVAVERTYVAGAPKWTLAGRGTTPLYPADPLADTVGSHADQHLRADLGTGGFDPVEVYQRMLCQTRGQAQAVPNMTVYVTAGPYLVDGAWHLWAGGSTGAIVAPAGFRCDLVYLGSDHALHVLGGTDGGSPAPRPTVPVNVFPICYVYLASTTTTITETEIEDARLVGAQTFSPAHAVQDEGTPLTQRANLNFVGAGVVATDDAGNNATVVTIAGGTGNHDLLDGSVDQDTVAGTVVDGDTIIGNATPKWQRLAISVPAANVRNVMGVDNGETRPSWKTALDGTNPTTIAAGDAASPGTSLVFAHRDHRHGAPATYPPALTVKEIDGAPSVAAVSEIRVTNGTLTDVGGGVAQLDFGSAATDGSAIHDNVASEIHAITEKVSPADADEIIIEDSADSYNKKRVQIGNLPGGTGGGDFLVMQVFS